MNDKTIYMQNTIAILTLLFFLISSPGPCHGAESIPDTLIVKNDTILIYSDSLKLDDDDYYHSEISYSLLGDTTRHYLDTVPVTICFSGVEFADYTFDSIPELVYCAGCGATGNCSQPIWRWNEDSCVFVLIADVAGNIDEENETVSYWWKLGCGGMAGGGATLKWIDNTFKTIRSIEGVCSDSGQFFTETDYAIPDSTSLYSKKVYNEEYFRSDSAQPILIEHQIFVPELSSFLRFSIDVIRDEKFLILIHEPSGNERNLTDEYYEQDSILNRTYSDLRDKLAGEQKKKLIRMERKWLQFRDQVAELHALLSENQIKAEYNRYISLISETKAQTRRLDEISEKYAE